MRTPSTLAAAGFLAALLSACQSTSEPERAIAMKGRAFASSEARRAFDRGLFLMWGFDHDAAIAWFREAAEKDSTAVLPWWGIALGSGPHINNSALDAAHARTAWEALGEAKTRLAHATPLERELVEALSARYASDFEAPRAPLDQAYAEAMRAVWRAYPEDADVGAWCAEALMDLHPWDLWTQDQREKPWTAEILAVLERVLELAPEHPGACHLYIHAQEAGPHPERAVPAAQRLAQNAGELGHLVHMPAHIDARLGRWADAADANRRAIAADRRHAKEVAAAGFYRVYMAHNQHFLAWASMMQGNSTEALRAARAMVAGVPKEFLAGMAPAIDGYMPVVLHVQVRFGRWEEVLATPPFADELRISNAVRRYARGVALTATNRLDEATVELADLEAAVAMIDDSRRIGNNPAPTVLRVPLALLSGELAFRRGEREAGLASLRKAVELQSELAYDEAPDWMTPSRHALGAALLEAQRFEEAEAVFRADLVQYPDNGWALFGLERALRGRGAEADARAAAEQFARAWEHADVVLRSPCFCQPGS